jgi:hypothetical protein
MMCLQCMQNRIGKPASARLPLMPAHLSSAATGCERDCGAQRLLASGVQEGDQRARLVQRTALGHQRASRLHIMSHGMRVT